MPTPIVAGADRAGMFSAVQHKRFRPLWTASILSGVAYVTALTALGWTAFDLHHHSSTVGLVVFASFLPSLIDTGQLFEHREKRPKKRDAIYLSRHAPPAEAAESEHSSLSSITVIDQPTTDQEH